MNTGDITQINTPEFDPDIDSGPSTKEHGEIQGSDNPIQHRVEETKKTKKSPCVTMTSRRRSGLAGCSTSQDPTSISPG